jgi:hypothetical protein
MWISRSVRSFLSYEQWGWFIFLIFILSCPMALYSGVIHLKTILYSRFKKEKLVIVNSSSRPSCRELFKELHILTLHSQYVFSLLMFVIKNRYLLKSNSDVHNLSTWYNSDLHLPAASLTIFQTGDFYSGIKMYNHFPQTLKELSYDVRWFRLALKRILLQKTFSSLEEYLCCKSYDWPRFLWKV